MNKWEGAKIKIT